MLLSAQIVSPAQEKIKQYAERAWAWSLRPKRYLDSTYVFQPAKNWSVSIGNEWTYPGFQMSSHFEFREPDNDADMDVLIQMKDRSFNDIGLHVGFGAIRLGLSREIGHRGGPNATYSFNWLSTSYGLKMRYSNYKEYPKAQINWVNNQNHSNFESGLLTSDYLSNLRMLVIDGFYAFNRHRFSYVSAYNGRVVQRKSAGSWMVAAKYMYGDLILDKNDVIFANMMNEMACFSTHQFSVGGGYSFNWVPFHKDAESPENVHGLRNWTLNLTVMPMLTIYNRLITKDNKAIPQKYGITGRVRPNFIARAGSSYAFGHFFVSIWADYSIFSFSTAQHSFSTGSFGMVSGSNEGYFSRWNAAIELNCRF